MAGMTNNLDADSLQTKVRQLAAIHDDSEIADICRITLGQVQWILRDVGAGKWRVRCNRTGQIFNARSERGGYLVAQLKGLSDWSYVSAP